MIVTTNFRDVYWVGVGYVIVVLLAITFVMEETMCTSSLFSFSLLPLTLCPYVKPSSPNQMIATSFPSLLVPRPVSAIELRRSSA
jgi:hypothetical protein